jgi:3-(3-hydroxy-phenyl)propionate hydroxylase
MEAPHDEHDRFFPMINLQQQYLEELPDSRPCAEPADRLRWGNRW